MSAVTVVGLDGRTPPQWALDRLAAAGLVVGAARHLQALPVPAQAHQVVLGDVAAGVAEVAAYPGPAVVLASGDPGFFGIVRALRAAGVEVEVAPAASSVAAAFAAVGCSWDDAVVVSAHGRSLRRALNACRALAKVAVLTAPGAGPAELAAGLAGWAPRRLVVAERLGGPDQRVVACSVSEAAAAQWAEPNVVLVLAGGGPEPGGHGGQGGPGWVAGARPTPQQWALAEEEFEHRDSMVSKAELRALALARLGPGVGELVWDLGCGSGSVAVECARLGAAVLAVDRDGEQCERARRNAARFGVDVQVRCAEAAAVLAELPDPDAVFVGGGGTELLRAAAARGARSVVAAYAAVERVGAARGALRDAGYRVGGVQLSAARLAELPDGGTRLAPVNPVFLVWGQR